MARKRSYRKRRIASLICACAAAILLPAVSCDSRTSDASAGSTAGWFAPDAIARLELDATVEALLVTVELPAGYRAADDFTQRLAVRAGEAVETDERSGLDEPFSVALPTTDPPAADPLREAVVEIMIGFCREGVPDVCYVDRSQLPVDRNAAARDDPSAGGRASLRYRPEPPL